MSDENTYFGFFCLQVDGPITGVGLGVGVGGLKTAVYAKSLPKNQTLLDPASVHVVLFGRAFKRCEGR